SHPGAGADDHRGACRRRHHRAHPEGADLDLPVVLPRRGRHGERVALARDHASRPDAHLQCQPRRRVLEAAAAGLRAVPVRLHEGGDRGEPGRGDRRRAAHGGGRRHRREAALGLILQPDHRHVRSTCRRFRGRCAARHHRRRCRPADGAGDGSASGMSVLRLFSWQAALALLLTVAAMVGLPLLSDGPASATVAILVLALAAILLSAARLPSWFEAAVLFIGAHGLAWLLIGAIDGHEGAARLSYFLLLAAAWLLAWRLVTVLSGWKLSSRGAGALLRIAIPALFGAWILILWEAIVRGTGIPFILLPPPSAIAERITASVPVLAADVTQTIFKAVV